MLTIQKDCSLSPDYPLTRLANPEEILFFDLETTGFSSERNQIYLIGCIWYTRSGWHLIQWLSEQPEDEPALLQAFVSFLKPFHLLLHFNGDRFDLPFLQKRCANHSLTWNPEAFESFDLYRNIKPFQKLIGLETLKQKSIEAFLGLTREDRYSGGELIPVYHTYLQNHDPQLSRLLLLHNEEDLTGMPSILPILSYPDFFHSSFTLRKQTVRETETPDGSERILLLCYESTVFLPVPLERNKEGLMLSLSENTLTFRIPLFQGECRRFYPDYQNYVYLVYEDNAVHKSIGQYVDKTAKKKATARTCYTRSQGIFLPQPSALFSPVLKKEYSDKGFYTPYREELFQNPSDAERYRTGLLAWFF